MNVILIAEDSHDDVFFYRRTFQKLVPQTKMDAVADGNAALDYLRLAASPPDMFLLDLKMPGINGFDVLSAIQREPNLRVTPTIVLTSSPLLQDAEQAIALGADGFITKPTSPDRLVFLFAALLKDWRQVCRMPRVSDKAWLEECGLGSSPDVL